MKEKLISKWLLRITSLCLISIHSVIALNNDFYDQNTYIELPTKQNNRLKKTDLNTYEAHPMRLKNIKDVSMSSSNGLEFDRVSNSPNLTHSKSPNGEVLPLHVRPLVGRLLIIQNNQVKPYSFLNQGHNLDYIVYYFASARCPICQSVTGFIVDAYLSLKQQYSNFEFVLVDFDGSHDAMIQYMKDYDIPWPTIKYNERSNVPLVLNNNGVDLPHLIIVDSGNTIVASSSKSKSSEAILKELKYLLQSSQE